MKNKRTLLLLVLISFVTLVKMTTHGFLLDYRVLFVSSSSMEPTFPVTSLLLEEKVTTPSKLAAGDVVTYKSDTKPIRITHRIIKINQSEQYAITKGDANDAPDGDKVNLANIEGKVVGVYPYPIQTLSILLFVIINSVQLKRFLSRKRRGE